MAPASAAAQHLHLGAELLADTAPAVARGLQLQALKCVGGSVASQSWETPCCPTCGTLFRTSADVSSIEVIQAGRSCRRRRRHKGTCPSNNRPAPKQSRGAKWFAVLQCQTCSSKVWQPGKSEQAAHAASAQFVRRAVRPQSLGHAAHPARPDAHFALLPPLSNDTDKEASCPKSRKVLDPVLRTPGKT